MDAWLMDRKYLRNDLLDLFSRLNGLQEQYDWYVTDHDLWFTPDCPDSVRRRWQWTGLLWNGQELCAHLSAGYVHFVSGGILSAVPKGTAPHQIWDYLPQWQLADFDAPDYHFQTPLTQMEIVCYDGYAWCILCESSFSAVIQKALPFAKTPTDFFAEG